MDSSASFQDEEDFLRNNENSFETELQHQPSRTSRRRLQPLHPTRTYTTNTCHNMRSKVLDWTCMVTTVGLLLVGLGYSWHNSHAATFVEGQRQVAEEPFLSEATATAYRDAPHSLAELDQVVSKVLSDLPSTEDGFYQPGQNERLLDDECMIDLNIEAFCEDCDEWTANSGLQEWPWCHSELTSITFLYTGCPCGTWYTIDYGKSSWSNETGQTSLAYECWEPDFLANSSEVPSEITCQDNSLPTLDGVDIQYKQASSAFRWVATAANDPAMVISSGSVSVGQEYTIESGDPNTPLPDFLTLTFFDQEDAVLQASTFPSSFCPGYPDPWYRHGYSQLQFVQVDDMTAGVVSVQDTLKEALWVKVTVDASRSPVPVRLEELSLIANINSEPINLTGTVRGVELNEQGGGGEWTMVTREGNNRSAARRSSIYSYIRSRQEPVGGSNTMTLMLGPMTMDMYWQTRYTFFGTIVATQANNEAIQCNGWDLAEYIGGLQ